MLSNEFAQKHRLCEFGMGQLNLNTNRDLKEMWFDENMPTCGTILMWIASRAQHEKKALIQCTAACVREASQWAGAAQADVDAAIDKVVGWCSGSSTRDDVDAVIQQALSKAKAAGARAEGKAEKQVWAAVSSLARCVRSVSCCSGAMSAVATAAEAAGESAEACQKRLAAKIRTMLPWSEVEASIRADRTSPRPRRKTAEEVAADTNRILGEFEALLSSLKAAQEQREQALAAAGTSSEKLRGFVDSGKLGTKNQATLAEKLAELDRQEAASGDSAKPGAAPPRRQRMIV